MSEERTMNRVKAWFVYRVMLHYSSKKIKKRYGSDFLKGFIEYSKASMNELLPMIPDLGKSIFSLNYYYAPSYFSFYKAACQLELPKNEALELIWQINENYISAFPAFLRRWFAKNMYLGAFRRKAAKAEEMGREGTLHPYDWRVEYKNIDKNTFQLDIYECAMLKLADKLGFNEMFPHVCRMDYLFSHYFGNSFRRTGTLADGNDCCDCWYQFPGKCEWAPEKGFIDRK